MQHNSAFRKQRIELSHGGEREGGGKEQTDCHETYDGFFPALMVVSGNAPLVVDAYDREVPWMSSV